MAWARFERATCPKWVLHIIYMSQVRTIRLQAFRNALQNFKPRMDESHYKNMFLISFRRLDQRGEESVDTAAPAKDTQQMANSGCAPLRPTDGAARRKKSTRYPSWLGLDLNEQLLQQDFIKATDTAAFRKWRKKPGSGTDHPPPSHSEHNPELDRTSKILDERRRVTTYLILPAVSGSRIGHHGIQNQNSLQGWQQSSPCAEFERASQKEKTHSFITARARFERATCFRCGPNTPRAQE
ncbi:hypothetical protein K438DRAFT_1773109 [Mycena galopus ATCC 62051]|nr:hypothetical protein K438DRAFT_1773109 [Mycena galopus ATCC 62051]